MIFKGRRGFEHLFAPADDVPADRGELGARGRRVLSAQGAGHYPFSLGREVRHHDPAQVVGGDLDHGAQQPAPVLAEVERDIAAGADEPALGVDPALLARIAERVELVDISGKLLVHPKLRVQYLDGRPDVTSAAE